MPTVPSMCHSHCGRSVEAEARDGDEGSVPLCMSPPPAPGAGSAGRAGRVGTSRYGSTRGRIGTGHGPGGTPGTPREIAAGRRGTAQDGGAGPARCRGDAGDARGHCRIGYIRVCGWA